MSYPIATQFMFLKSMAREPVPESAMLMIHYGEKLVQRIEQAIHDLKKDNIHSTFLSLHSITPPEANIQWNIVLVDDETGVRPCPELEDKVASCSIIVFREGDAILSLRLKENKGEIWGSLGCIHDLRKIIQNAQRIHEIESLTPAETP